MGKQPSNQATEQGCLDSSRTQPQRSVDSFLPITFGLHLLEPSPNVGNASTLQPQAVAAAGGPSAAPMVPGTGLSLLPPKHRSKPSKAITSPKRSSGQSGQQKSSGNAAADKPPSSKKRQAPASRRKLDSGAGDAPANGGDGSVRPAAKKRKPSGGSSVHDDLIFLEPPAQQLLDDLLASVMDQQPAAVYSANGGVTSQAEAGPLTSDAVLEGQQPATHNGLQQSSANGDSGGIHEQQPQQSQPPGQRSKLAPLIQTLAKGIRDKVAWSSIWQLGFNLQAPRRMLSSEVPCALQHVFRDIAMDCSTALAQFDYGAVGLRKKKLEAQVGVAAVTWSLIPNMRQQGIVTFHQLTCVLNCVTAWLQCQIQNATILR